MADKTYDVLIDDQGTIVLFRPTNENAKTWLQEHTGEDSQWFGGALVVEHRYAADLAIGLYDAGLTLYNM